VKDFLIFLPYVFLGIVSGFFNLLYSLRNLKDKIKGYPLFKFSKYWMRYPLWILFQIGLPALFFVFTVWLCQTPIIDFDSQSPIDATIPSSITIKQYLQAINYLAFFQVFLYCVLFGLSFPILVNNLDVFTIKATYDTINETFYQHIADQETGKTTRFEMELENYLTDPELSNLNQGIRYLEKYLEKDYTLTQAQKTDYLRELEDIKKNHNPSEKAKQIVKIRYVRSKDYPTLLHSFNLPQNWINQYFPKSR
jgi:hypothetical protein